MEFMKEAEIVGVISGKSTAKASVGGRQSHTLVYKLFGDSEYILRGKRVLHRAGDLLYIPEGEVYSFKRLTADGSYRLVNFHASCDVPPRPRLFPCVDRTQIPLLMERMEKKMAV